MIIIIWIFMTVSGIVNLQFSIRKLQIVVYSGYIYFFLLPGNSFAYAQYMHC